MHYNSLKNHLKPYNIVQKRRTTINHAFAAAVAPHDEYDDVRIRAALMVLGQDSEGPLKCAYCGELAQTWDHVEATVLNGEFSGWGHRLGNLLPCCKQCNSAKGNRNWAVYMQGLANLPGHEARLQAISMYLDAFRVHDALDGDTPEMHKMRALRGQILELMKEADELAANIRTRA